MRLIALLLLCCLPGPLRAGPDLHPETHYPAEMPVVPSEAEVAALADAILAQPVADTPGGEVALVTVGADPMTRFGISADQTGLPDWRGQAILIGSGQMSLPQVAAAVGPDWIVCDGTVCDLHAPLFVGRGAVLVIDGLTLRLSATGGAYVANFGRLDITGAVIEGWDLRTGMPAWTGPLGAEFRPFLSGFEDAHTTIRGSVLRHLGYQAPMAYGNSHGTFQRGAEVVLHPSVDMVGNVVTDLYFGFYSYHADGVRILANDIRDCHVYGIDPHDDTRDMLIASNHVEGAQRSHGIIGSRRITDTVVAWNTSVGNYGSGIFFDKASHHIQIVGNLSVGNGKDGIVLHESHDIRIADNIVRDNAHNGIRLRASGEVEMVGNVIMANRRAAISAYDWTFSTRLPNEEEIGQIEPVTLTLTGNIFLNNTRNRCVWRGDVQAWAWPADADGC